MLEYTAEIRKHFQFYSRSSFYVLGVDQTNIDLPFNSIVDHHTLSVRLNLYVTFTPFNSIVDHRQQIKQMRYSSRNFNFQFYSRSSDPSNHLVIEIDEFCFQFYSRSSSHPYKSPLRTPQLPFNSIVDHPMGVIKYLVLKKLSFQFYSRSSSVP